MVRLWLERGPAALFARGHKGHLHRKKGHMAPHPAAPSILPAFLSLPLLADARVDSRSIKVDWAAVRPRPRLFSPHDGRQRAC